MSREYYTHTAMGSSTMSNCDFFPFLIYKRFRLYPVDDSLSKQVLIDDGDSEAYVIWHFMEAASAANLFSLILNNSPWKNTNARETFWYSKLSYNYSGVTHSPFSEDIPYLDDIMNRVNIAFNVQVNSILCNLYRGGENYLGWHSDNESCLGAEPVICSISLGQSREFSIRHKNNFKNEIKVNLTSGSMLIMAKKTQLQWDHRVTSDFKAVGARINLTLRKILS